MVLGIVFSLTWMSIISFIPIVIGIIVGHKPHKEAKRLDREFGDQQLKLTKERYGRLHDKKVEGYERYIEREKDSN